MFSFQWANGSTILASRYCTYHSVCSENRPADPWSRCLGLDRIHTPAIAYSANIWRRKWLAHACYHSMCDRNKPKMIKHINRELQLSQQGHNKSVILVTLPKLLKTNTSDQNKFGVSRNYLMATSQLPQQYHATRVVLARYGFMIGVVWNISNDEMALSVPVGCAEPAELWTLYATCWLDLAIATIGTQLSWFVLFADLFLFHRVVWPLTTSICNM